MTKQEKQQINKEFRAKDESHKWPISGKFNVANRAINRAAKWERNGGSFDSAESYRAFLEDEVSKIVNNPYDW